MPFVETRGTSPRQGSGSLPIVIIDAKDSVIGTVIRPRMSKRNHKTQNVLLNINSQTLEIKNSFSHGFQFLCTFLFTVVQLGEHQKVSASLEESVVVGEEQNSLTRSKMRCYIISHH